MDMDLGAVTLPTLAAAVQQGAVNISYIDRAVSNVLTAKVGWPWKKKRTTQDSPFVEFDSV